MEISYDLIVDLAKVNQLVNNSNDLNAGRDIMVGYYGDPVVEFRILDRPNVVNGVVWRFSNVTVSVLGGVRDDLMRGNIILGWGDKQGTIRDRGMNPWARASAVNDYGNIILTSVQGDQPWIAYGHSGGALVTHALNDLQRERGAPTSATVVTTGSPRVKGPGGPADWPASTYYRFMNSQDVITICPPRFDEAPYVVALAAGITTPSPLQALLNLANDNEPNIPLFFWPQWSHSPGGITITSQGLPIVGDTPMAIGDAMTRYAGFAQFVALAEGAPVHDISVYITHLDRWRNKFGGGNPPEDEFGLAGDVLPSQDLTGSAIIRDFFILPVDVGGNIQLPGQGGTVMSQSQGATTGTMPSPSGTTIGCLYLRGEMVACFKTRSRARTAARALNRFLAKLPQATEVSLSGLTDGAATYLADAALGGGVDKRPVRVIS